jgi:putative transcriptional regulator
MTTTMKSRLRILIAEKETREGRRISLRRLSEETGISLNTLKGMHSGKQEQYSITVLDRLATYFDCSLDDLFERGVAEENSLALPLPAKAA